MSPRVVALYSLITGGPVRVAEIRYRDETGMTVDVLDPEWGTLARTYAEKGIRSLELGRTFTARDGPAFMQALVEPRHTSYHHMVDESDGHPDGGEG